MPASRRKRHRPSKDLRYVVFDVGGVLIHWDDRQVTDAAAQGLEEPKERLHALLERFRPLLQAGRVDLDGFWDLFEREIGKEVPRDIRDSWWTMLERKAQPQWPVIRWAAQLRRAGLKTALFSNTEASHRRFFARTWSRGFEPQLRSYELRAVKPSPLAFRRARAVLGVPADHLCLFDDLPRNARAARKAGWRAHVFDPFHGVRGARQYLREIDWIR